MQTFRHPEPDVLQVTYKVDLCRNLYNAANEHRRAIHDRFIRTEWVPTAVRENAGLKKPPHREPAPTLYDQMKKLTAIRAANPEIKSLGVSLARGALAMLEAAWKPVSKLNAAGKTTPPPRFKARSAAALQGPLPRSQAPVVRAQPIGLSGTAHTEPCPRADRQPSGCVGTTSPATSGTVSACEILRRGTPELIKRGGGAPRNRKRPTGGTLAPETPARANRPGAGARCQQAAAVPVDPHRWIKPEGQMDTAPRPRR